MPPEPAVSTSRFGPFELCEELASGGMASVWLAVKRAEGGFLRVCALKRVHPHLAKKSSFVDMFLDEARIAARIDHPNVCKVFDYGRVDGTPYIAMEYLAGVSVAELLRTLVSDGGNAELPALCSMVADAAAGLHAAHELRDEDGESLEVVHRDISPQNLFLTYDGVIKVVDFGIASARDKVHETATGEVKGKFAYMAPEQMRGRKVDRRADVWSLGVVLWELLTRKRLFRRNTQAETMDAVLRARFEPPSHHDPLLPSSLDDVARHALETDPESRCGSMAELVAELREGLPEPLWDRRGLEAWINRLFPEGRAEASRRVEQTLATAKRQRRQSVAPPGEGSPSDSWSTADTRRAKTPAPEEPAALSPPSSPASRMALVAGLTILLGVGGGATWALMSAQGPAPETVTEPAPPAVSTEPYREPAQPVPLEREDEPETDPSIAEPETDLSVAEPVAEDSPPRRGRMRRSRMSSPMEAPAADEPAETGTGCVSVGLGVRARIGSETVEGPVRVEVPAGRVAVTILGGTPERRTLQVAPGRDCRRLTRGS